MFIPGTCPSHLQGLILAYSTMQLISVFPAISLLVTLFYHGSISLHNLSIYFLLIVPSLCSVQQNQPDVGLGLQLGRSKRYISLNNSVQIIDDDVMRPSSRTLDKPRSSSRSQPGTCISPVIGLHVSQSCARDLRVTDPF